MARKHSEDRYRTRAPARRIIITNGEDYRTYQLRPWLVAPLVLLGTLLSVAYLGATAYLVFRDDLIDASIARTADLQQAYEDRIASLRSEIDRIASRQLLEQVAYDQKVEKLLSRQAELAENRRMIDGLIESARKAGLSIAATGGAPEPVPTRRQTGSLEAPDVTGSLGKAASAYAPATRAAGEDAFAALSAPVIPTTAATPRLDPIGGSTGQALRGSDQVIIAEADRPDLGAMARELGALDQAQATAAQAIAAAADSKVASVDRVLRGIGVNLKLARASEEPAETTDVGGPFLPLGNREALTAAVSEAAGALESLGRVRGAVHRLPIANPLPDATITSKFGSRSDPFLGRLALHSGIDFRSPTGRSVPATAAGRIVTAGRNGGYGLMVEVDHGKGLSTRYAHLSRISVSVGDRVERGTKVGEVGSTGRSTGPHLHYETRVSGTAVNPLSYLEAGRKVEALLR
ncbi:M23 family metallopeptidase [Methylobrevis albus]|uniref:M23 family metallopeptidase n=1 Tax=Methylobrevis albus TaxID=2793297 RepID=A0A931I2U8_9HYPH|nr:M23 family metallopeptidase [Methylobrevis albus]MBH0239222.1 M23 family metallopeptidase [Methylobrevis albus]